MEKLILECMVRSALIALCTAAALFALRVRTARVRHSVWAGVVVLMLVLPVWTAWGPKAVLRVLTPERALVNVQPAVETMQNDIDAPPVPQRETWTWQIGLAAIYLLGLSGLLVRLGIGTVRARKLTSESCVAPITVGWLAPVVILPAGWKQWSQAQLDAVITHEGEHVRRRDPLVQWLALFNRAVFWFHPLAWWLERRLSALAEEACDDAVLVRGHDPVQYSECLLELARVVQQAGARVSVVGMAMPGTFLPQRIRRIVAGVPVQRVSPGRMICMAVTCAVVSTVFTVGAIGYYAPPPVPVAVAPPLLDIPRTDAIAPKKKRILIAQARPATTNQSLWGMVIDPSGKGVANAPVTLTGPNGAAGSVTADSTGMYRFPDIEPGTYTVTVSAPGFKRGTQADIVVAAGEARSVGAMYLQLGSISDSISVTGSRSAPATANPVPNNEERKQFVQQFWLRRDTAVAADATRPVQPANLLIMTKPVYPPDLRQQGIQGTVKIEAVISKDGLPESLRVVSNVDPRLTQLALDAVRQWRYSPMMLNGEPVEVTTTIDVNFVLEN